MKLKGIVLDVDGTMADTEEIHRQAFNQTFDEFDLNWRWSKSEYQKQLLISGGKERFKKCLNKDKALKNKVENQGLFIQKLHKRKSEHYRSMLASDEIQLRPGITRLINEAQDKRILLGIATSSSMANLRTLLNKTLNIDPDELFNAIITSDTVSDKKPSPVVYQCAHAGLGLSPDTCIAIEDTRNGNLSALSAGLHTIITTHAYTIDNDFTGASLVVNHLGEPNNGFTQVQGIECDKSYVDIELLNYIISSNDDELSKKEISDIGSGIN
ncbi:MAG: HAD-IA family hydrolase [Proteobacteria bacterium]|nr:HAD-IA family hydrolase [Pseudomonadota bacterium]